ncbi:MAG: HD domain-containing protein [candidate division WOR-3 bacterium]|nr:HD domain-containing protein [candidate division WOR-3 bacterium]
MEIEFESFKLISDGKIRDKTRTVWERAIEEGGWNDISDIPFTLLIETKKTLLDHTNTVTEMSIGVGQARGDIDFDLLISGAILHDVGKLLEYERKDGKIIKSEYGKRIRHPIIGAMLAREASLPLSIQHIILAHSVEGEKLIRIPEAIIVHHCDYIDFYIEKLKTAVINS